MLLPSSMLTQHVCTKAPWGVLLNEDGKVIAAPVVSNIWPDEARCVYCHEKTKKPTSSSEC